MDLLIAPHKSTIALERTKINPTFGNWRLFAARDGIYPMAANRA
jgi:hypothetical protein